MPGEVVPLLEGLAANVALERVLRTFPLVTEGKLESLTVTFYTDV